MTIVKSGFSGTVMKNHQKGFILIGMSLFLIAIFATGIFASNRGWGYPGYDNDYESHSIFYWGPNIYRDRSIRESSINGANHRGGGLSGGK